MNTLPTKSFPYVYHIGTMKAEKKEIGSLEGAGLSISLHPNEWDRIARRLVGSLFQLSKPNHAFLAYYSLSEEEKQKIIAWGIQKKYITEQTLYRVQYFDDEMNDEVYCDYTNKALAEEEAEDYGVELIEIQGHCATDIMKEKVMNDSPPILVFSLLTTLYVEEETNLDGVWWEEELDVYRLSAPRGVIASSKVKEWEIANQWEERTPHGWDASSVRDYCPCCETDSVEKVNEEEWVCQNPSCLAVYDEWEEIEEIED